MLKHRLILGAVLIAALVALIWLVDFMPNAGAWVLIGVLAILVAAGGRELAALLSRDSLRVDRCTTTAGGLLGLAFVVWMAMFPREVQSFSGVYTGTPHDLAVWGVGLALVAGSAWGMRTKDVHVAVYSGAAACLSAVYLGVFISSALLLAVDFGAWGLLGVLAVIKSCDIGAYFVGMNFGKRKLIPWLSPGKTWEGLFGGLATAAAVGAAFSFGAEWLHWGWGAGLGAVIGLAGQGGDLFESALKRGAGVKDSGRVPGFGGVLDLLDSPLVGLPVALWLLRLASEVA